MTIWGKMNNLLSKGTQQYQRRDWNRDFLPKQAKGYPRKAGSKHNS